MPVKTDDRPSIFCLRCSYSLEGLRRNRCPECGYEFDIDDSSTFTRRPRLKFLRQWFVRFSFSFVFSVMLLGITLLAVHLAYPPYVERRFAKVIESLEAEYEVSIKESRCLAKRSENILLLPILESRITDNYPFLQTDSKGKSYMDNSYYHGLYFSYSKTLILDGQRVSAYWSIRENRWHVGEFDWSRYGLDVWQCICKSCPNKNKSIVLSTNATH